MGTEFICMILMNVGFKSSDRNTFSGLWGESCGLIEGDSTILFHARPQKNISCAEVWLCDWWTRF